ncbi:helix-turn-helix domain-containing protein [soil metagenome]
MIKNVAVIAQPGVEAFGLGVLCEVWAEPDHPEDACPTFDFAVCTPTPGRIKGMSGFDIVVDNGLDRVAEADLVALAPNRDHDRMVPEVAEAIWAAYDRGATIMAFCTAVFGLAAIGMLDGRTCTTHWRHAARLKDEFPHVDVDPDVLYVHDGQIITGAGSAGGLDACLHLMRDHFGARVAATTARRIVVPPQRDGGQAQFVRTPMGLTKADSLAPLLAWALDHVGENLSVETLAHVAHMSPRTFARRFKDETGTTPLQWLTSQRVALAEERLELTNDSVERIAAQVGFGNAATLRAHFTAVRGTTPQAYRKAFGCAETA